MAASASVSPITLRARRGASARKESVFVIWLAALRRPATEAAAESGSMLNVRRRVSTADQISFPARRMDTRCMQGMYAV